MTSISASILASILLILECGKFHKSSTNLEILSLKCGLRREKRQAVLFRHRLSYCALLCSHKPWCVRGEALCPLRSQGRKRPAAPARCLLEVSVKQTLKSLAVTSFTAVASCKVRLYAHTKKKSKRLLPLWRVKCYFAFLFAK